MASPRFSWHNSERLEDAQLVIYGVPDETGSKAERKGASAGPDRMRLVSNRMGLVVRGGTKSLFQPQLEKLKVKIHDAGNVEKGRVTAFVSNIAKAGKVPIGIGGDHSISYEILRGIDGLKRNWSFVYFDAHPDFICSEKQYYGSVVCDISGLRNVDLRSSFIIGVRAPEVEEVDNIFRSGVNVVTAVDLVEMGVREVAELVRHTVTKNLYISVDMDVVDPAFAPGVDMPIPGGITGNELIYLVKKTAELGAMGFDVMEVSPPYDRDDMTAYLASRVIIEAISCIKLRTTL